MLNHAERVECQISDAALDELGGVKGTESAARQALFLALRDAVEDIASDIFDTAPHVRGQIVRIFTKHVLKSSAQQTEPTTATDKSEAGRAASLRAFAQIRPADAAE